MKKILALSLLGVCCLNGDVIGMNNPQQSEQSTRNTRATLYPEQAEFFQALQDCPELSTQYKQAFENVQTLARQIIESLLTFADEKNSQNLGITVPDDVKKLWLANNMIENLPTGSSLKEVHCSLVENILMINWQLGSVLMQDAIIVDAFKNASTPAEVKARVEAMQQNTAISAEPGTALALLREKPAPASLEEQIAMLNEAIPKRQGTCQEGRVIVTELCARQNDSISKIQDDAMARLEYLVNSADNSLQEGIGLVQGDIEELDEQTRKLRDEWEETFTKQLEQLHASSAVAQEALSKLCNRYRAAIAAFETFKLKQMDDSYEEFNATILGVIGRLRDAH